MARCEVRECELGKGVFLVEPAAAGECVVALSEVFVDAPDRHTIQVGDGRHQAFTGETDDFLNHACAPTTVLDLEALCFVAVRAVAAGEEATFHYGSTEWDMAEPFTCSCDGTERMVQGFRHLSAAEQQALQPLVPAWLWARRHRDPARE